MRKVPAPIHVSATKAHLEQELEITAEGRDEKDTGSTGTKSCGSNSIIHGSEARQAKSTRTAEG